MQDVELTPEGIFVHKWNSEHQKWVKKRARKNLIFTHLKDSCKIAEGFTLGNLFDIVDSYKLLKFFLSQYSWCRAIDEFHKQAKEPNDDTDEDKINYLEIYWHPEVHKYEEKIKHKSGLRERIKVIDFDADPCFHGIGDNDHYSVSWSPMNHLAHLPLKLNKSFIVYEPFDHNKHNKDNRPEKILEANREFTLLEILDAIYWDISFYGGPQQTKELIEDMKQRVEEINSGEAECVSWEELFEEDETLDDPEISEEE